MNFDCSFFICFRQKYGSIAAFHFGVTFSALGTSGVGRIGGEVRGVWWWREPYATVTTVRGGGGGGNFINLVHLSLEPQ